MTEATPKKPRARKTSTTKTTTTSKPRARKAPATLDLPLNPLAFEVLDLVSRQRTKAKKVEALQKHKSLPLQQLLIWNFDDTIVSELPEGEVPYGDPEESVKYSGSLSEAIASKSREMYDNGNFSLGNADAAARTTIRAQAKNFYHFIRGGNPGLTKMRRETMFINLLNSLHPLEAELVVLAKDGLIGETYKITKEVVAEAYPEIRWGGRG